MAKLPDPVKAFIVERLACFARPTEVVDAVKEEFGLVIKRQHVEVYDPEKGCKVKRWIEMHASIRKSFTEQRAGLAITHRSWRMMQLEEMARAARKSRNYKLAKELLEQAAKEDGDFYLNRPRGGEHPAETEEQRIQMLRARMDEMDAATLGTPVQAPQLVVSNGAAA